MIEFLFRLEEDKNEMQREYDRTVKPEVNRVVIFN